MIRAKESVKLWRDMIRKIDNAQLAKELSKGRPNHYNLTLVSGVVNGEREPSMQMMKRFCLLMGCDLGDIFTIDRFSVTLTDEKPSES